MAVDPRSCQLPSNRVIPEFGEVNVKRGPSGTVVQFLMRPTMQGAKKEGWQTGVALDASYSMRNWYGRGMQGKVPPEIMADYERRGLVVEKVIDGRNVKRMQPAAHEDAVRRGLMRPTENLVQPLARNFIGLLAERLDEDGGTTVVYWACGDGSKVEVLGDFTAAQCRTLELRGPIEFGAGTRLLPAVKYFAERFADANKGIYVFLADGAFEDLAEVKRYTTQLARAIANEKRNPIKCVVVGVGNQIDTNQLAELDDLDTGTDVDIWDHKIAAEMRGLTDIFAELVNDNEIVAPWAKAYDPTGKLVKRFTTGLPAKATIRLPPGSAFFDLELANKRIRQPLVVSGT